MSVTKLTNSLLESALDETSLAIDDSDVAKHLVLLLSVRTELVKLGVVLSELGDKLVAAGNVGESGGDEGLGREGSKALGEGREGGEG